MADSGNLVATAWQYNAEAPASESNFQCPILHGLIHDRCLGNMEGKE